MAQAVPRRLRVRGPDGHPRAAGGLGGPAPGPGGIGHGAERRRAVGPAARVADGGRRADAPSRLDGAARRGGADPPTCGRSRRARPASRRADHLRGADRGGPGRGRDPRGRRRPGRPLRRRGDGAALPHPGTRRVGRRQGVPSGPGGRCARRRAGRVTAGDPAPAPAALVGTAAPRRAARRAGRRRLRRPGGLRVAGGEGGRRVRGPLARRYAAAGRRGQAAAQPPDRGGLDGGLRDGRGPPPPGRARRPHRRGARARTGVRRWWGGASRGGRRRR